MLVTVNTVLIARGVYPGVLVVGFLISFIWSFNVKRVAFGTVWDRVVYSCGAASGGLLGLWLGGLLV